MNFDFFLNDEIDDLSMQLDLSEHVARELAAILHVSTYHIASQETAKKKKERKTKEKKKRRLSTKSQYRMIYFSSLLF